MLVITNNIVIVLYVYRFIIEYTHAVVCTNSTIVHIGCIGLAPIARKGA